MKKTRSRKSRDTVSDIFNFRSDFFYESISPKPPSIPIFTVKEHDHSHQCQMCPNFLVFLTEYLNFLKKVKFINFSYAWIKSACPGSPSRSGSRSGKMMRIRPDPDSDQDSQHFYKQTKNHSHFFFVITANDAGFWWLAET
jgi:hypothetical protein